MIRLGIFKTLARLAPLLLSSPALSQATVLVPADEGFAWEVRDLKFAPRKTSDQGVSVARINTWIAEHAGMKQVSKICFMDFVQNDEIYSFDVKTQKDINADLNEYKNSFSQTFSPDATTTFLVRVGAFQLCDPSDNGTAVTFMGVVVTDSFGEVRLFDPMTWNFSRLFKRDDGIVNILGCFSCGDVKELAWDKFKNRFYFIDIGH
ncbi:hypothetical protein GR702_21720 [Novosphingobium sp. FGD1]|uniref:Uncharacterized protein n=1 Tax=Novosphingobium silvae TaxID=2692619 RepID=A0A7X4KAD6_9SPHN|nr:hypothetical protein [Novosphingobium silvae]MYM00359.1 hypothetical protein [Novosphingobium silvae]